MFPVLYLSPWTDLTGSASIDFIRTSTVTSQKRDTKGTSNRTVSMQCACVKCVWDVYAVHVWRMSSTTTEGMLFSSAWVIPRTVTCELGNLEVPECKVCVLSCTVLHTHNGFEWTSGPQEKLGLFTFFLVFLCFQCDGVAQLAEYRTQDPMSWGYNNNNNNNNNNSEHL